MSKKEDILGYKWKAIGPFRFVQENQAYLTEVLSPAYSVMVWVMLTIFKDGEARLDFWSSKGLAEGDRFNVGSPSYTLGRGYSFTRATQKEMKRDISEALITIDKYYSSWQDEAAESEQN